MTKEEVTERVPTARLLECSIFGHHGSDSRATGRGKFTGQRELSTTSNLI